MINRCVLATVLSAVMAIGAVSAQEASIDWTDWVHMNPDSYLIDIEEMDNRCLEGASVTSVTVTECLEAKQLLQSGLCDYLPIPDGTHYEFLIGLRSGESHVYQNRVKRLRVSRMAYSCRLSTGRTIDWYAGEDGKSCGNVAARPLSIIASYVPPTMVVEEKPTDGFDCRNVPSHRHEGNNILFVPGVDIGNVCNEPHFVSGYLYQEAELEVFGQSTKCVAHFDETFK